jgi:hypothetical protein
MKKKMEFDHKLRVENEKQYYNMVKMKHENASQNKKYKLEELVVHQ